MHGLHALTQYLDVASLARLELVSKSLAARARAETSVWKRAFLALRAQFPSVIDGDDHDWPEDFLSLVRARASCMASPVAS